MFSPGWLGSRSDAASKSSSAPAEVDTATAPPSANGRLMTGHVPGSEQRDDRQSEPAEAVAALSELPVAEEPPATTELHPELSHNSDVPHGLTSSSLDASSLKGLEVDNLDEWQLQWERQAASADAKQAEIFHSQWNLAREQICTCSRELLVLCSQIRTMRLDLDAEVSQRRELAAQLEARLEALLPSGPQCSCDSKDMDAESEVQHRLHDVDQQVEALRMACEEEVRERGASEQQLRAQMDALRIDFEAEVRERGATEQQLRRDCEELQSLLCAETACREVELSKHQRALQALHDERARARPFLLAAGAPLAGSPQAGAAEAAVVPTLHAAPVLYGSREESAEQRPAVNQRDLPASEAEQEEELRSMLCDETQSSAASPRCRCGNLFTDDGIFCRRCGTKRPVSPVVPEVFQIGSERADLGAVRVDEGSGAQQPIDTQGVGGDTQGVPQPVDALLETGLEKVRQEIVEAQAVLKEEMMKLQASQAEQVSMHVAEALGDIDSLCKDLRSGAESAIQAAAQVEQRATRQELLDVTETFRQELKAFEDRVQDLENQLKAAQCQKQDGSEISDEERYALTDALQQVQHEFRTGNEEALQALQEERVQLEALKTDLDAEVHKRHAAEEQLRRQCEELRGELVKHHDDLQELRGPCTEVRPSCVNAAAETAAGPESVEVALGTPTSPNSHHSLNLQLEELMAQVADNKQVAQELMTQVAVGNLQAAPSTKASIDDIDDAASCLEAVSSQVHDLRKEFKAHACQRSAAEEQLKQAFAKHQRVLTWLSSEASSRTEELLEHQQAVKQECEELRSMITADAFNRTIELSRHEQHQQVVKQECEQLRGMVHAETSRSEVDQLRKDFEVEVRQRGLGDEQLKRECEQLRSMLSTETASFSDLLSKHWQALKRQNEELRGMLHAETACRTDELSNQQQALKRQCEQMQAILSAEVSSRSEELSKVRQVLKRECEELKDMLSEETSSRTSEFLKHQQGLKRECEELRGIISAETSSRTEELSKHRQIAKRECDDLRGMLSAETCSRTEELARHRQSLQALQRARTDETYAAAAVTGHEQVRQELHVEHQRVLQVLTEEREHVDQLRVDFENETRNRAAADESLERQCEELQTLLHEESASRASALVKHRQELQALHEERGEELSAALEQVRQEFDAKRRWDLQALHYEQMDALRKDFETEMHQRSAADEQIRRECNELLATVRVEISNIASKKQREQEDAEDVQTKNHDALVVAMEQLRHELQAKDDDRVDEAAATNCQIQSLRHEMDKDRKEMVARCAEFHRLCDELQESVGTLSADEAGYGFELERLHKAVEHEAHQREKLFGEVRSVLEQLQIRFETAATDVRPGRGRKGSERQELCAHPLPAPAMKVKVVAPFLESIQRPDVESQSGPEIETTADSQVGSLARKQQEDTASSLASLTPPFSFCSTQGCSGGSAIHRTEDESQGVGAQSLPWDSFNTCHLCSETVEEIKRELSSWLHTAFDDEFKVRLQTVEHSDSLHQDSQCEMKEITCARSAGNMLAKSRVDVETCLEDVTHRVDSFSSRFQDQLAGEKQERMREISEIRSSLLGLGIADLTREAQALRWHIDQTAEGCAAGEDVDVSKWHVLKQSWQGGAAFDPVVLLRQDLSAERDARIEETSRLLCNFQCLEDQISTNLQQIHEQVKTLGSNALVCMDGITCEVNHGTTSAAALVEVQSDIVALREALERETRLREDASAQIVSDVHQLQEQVDTDCNERAKEIAYLVERLRFVPDVKEREDVSVRRLEDMSASLRSEMLTYRNKHAEDYTVLSGSFEDLQTQIIGQLERLKEHLPTHIAEVVAGERHMTEGDPEADIGRGPHSVDVEEMQRELVAMRHDLDHYSRMSAQSSETTAAALRRVQDQLEIESGNRSADVAELSEHMQLESISHALRLEMKKIQDGTTTRLGELQSNLEGLEVRVAEQLEKAKTSVQAKEMITASASDATPAWKDQTNSILRRLQEQIDLEVQERSRVMAGFSEHLQSLPDALTMEVHEHVQEFREDLDAQTATMHQDLLSEREERAIEGAALRCSLQSLEGRTEDKITELRCSLDAATSLWKAFKSASMKTPGRAEQLNSSSPTTHQHDLQALEGAAAMVGPCNAA